MTEILHYQINLDSDQPVYYPGQKINGNVYLVTKAPLEVNHIWIKLTGAGLCHWTESRRGKVVLGKSKKKQADYTGSETLIKRSQHLFQASDVTDQSTFFLPAGQYTYPFSFYLKGDLPSSFEGSYGYIRYMLRTVISKPGLDHVRTSILTVNDVIDTNHSKFSRGITAETPPPKCCIKVDHLYMRANLARSCYCPGEAILINADVENRTSTDMKHVYTKLVQIITYRAYRLDKEYNKKKAKTKVIIKDIAKLVGPSLPKEECVCWTNQAFGIPAIPPTIENSKVITVQYRLKLMVAVQETYDPSLKLCVTIGTVPHIPTFGEPVQYGTLEDPQGVPESNYIAGQTRVSKVPKIFGYPGMAPPTYSAAVGDNEINIGRYMVVYEYTENYCDKTYVPVYTFVQPVRANSSEWDTGAGGGRLIQVQTSPDAIY